MTPSVGFTPKLGNSNVRVNALITPSSSTVGAGGNALRIVNEGTNSLTIYFVTYNSADGVPTVSPLYTGVPVCFHASGANDLVIVKPREHDSVYHISSSASIANVVMFQSGEV